jgi:hypothetical protein
MMPPIYIYCTHIIVVQKYDIYLKQTNKDRKNYENKLFFDLYHKIIAKTFGNSKKEYYLCNRK